MKYFRMRLPRLPCHAFADSDMSEDEGGRSTDRNSKVGLSTQEEKSDNNVISECLDSLFGLRRRSG